MKCKLCNSQNVEIEYEGLIRDGGIGNYTDKDIKMFRCKKCNVIWHEPILKSDLYYESEEYRVSLEGTSEEAEFYRLHDKEVLDKFIYTGTEVFRNKIVADIGCGCGNFLDFIKGPSKKIIAIEPSNKYREYMKKKGFETYAYADDAKEWKGKVDLVTSFDVIEHVESPLRFLADIKDLLRDGGMAIIGTPTEAPIMRSLLGKTYEKKLLFSTQHLWIFAEENLRILASEAGFSLDKFEAKYFQRYDMGNALGWLKNQEGGEDIKEPFITKTLNCLWKTECETQGLSDYIVIYLVK